MSGIAESTVGTHATRQPSGQEKQMIDDILCLYQLKPSHQAYSHYAENAVFHDPVSISRSGQCQEPVQGHAKALR